MARGGVRAVIIGWAVGRCGGVQPVVRIRGEVDRRQAADGRFGDQVVAEVAVDDEEIVDLRRKQVYKITYPNGKIYVGMDLTGTLLYMGSPSAHEQIAADLELEPHRFDLTLRKEILWESETATDAEVRAKEIELIRETGANNPRIGYNVIPRWLG